jgi:hypothetical protein
MRVFLVLTLIGFLTLSALLGTTSYAIYDEVLDVIVNEKAPVERLSGYEVEALFTRTQTHWSDGSVVYPFSFPAGSEAREYFDRVALRLGPEEVGRFWMDRKIRGLGSPPRQVPSALLMVQVIANLAGSVGYIPSTQTAPGVKVVARVLRGKVVSP